MMQPLIFTEQRLLPRLFDFALTALAWGALGYLIYFDLVKDVELHPHTGPRPFYSTLGTISLYFLVAVLNGVALIAWAKYNQFRFRVERRKRRPELEQGELAESFEISPALVAELNSSRVQTVYHDRHGKITRVAVDRTIADGLPPPNAAEPLLLARHADGAKRR